MRQPKTTARSRLIVDLDPEDKERLLHLAEAEGATLRAVVTRLIREEYERQARRK